MATITAIAHPGIDALRVAMQLLGERDDSAILIAKARAFANGGRDVSGAILPTTGATFTITTSSGRRMVVGPVVEADEVDWSDFDIPTITRRKRQPDTPPQADEPQAVADAIAKAIESKSALAIRYVSPDGRQSERDVLPREVTKARDGGLNLQAVDLANHQSRTFKVSRIAQAQPAEPSAGESWRKGEAMASAMIETGVNVAH